MPIEWKDIKKEFAKPFPVKEIEWRVQNVNTANNSGLALAYIDSRAVQNRLDEVVGVENWRNEFKAWHTLSKDAVCSQICGVSIFLDERKEWVTKWDGAENTDIEPIKGGISDAFKRSAVQWGIGRYLYEFDAMWVDVEQRGRTWYIAKKEFVKLENAYNEFLKKLGADMPAKAKESATAEKPEPKKTSPPLKADNAAKQKEPLYKIVAVGQKQFKSGVGSVLSLEQENGEVIEAFLQAVDAKLKKGIRINDVKINRTPGRDENTFFNIVEKYKIAA